MTGKYSKQASVLHQLKARVSSNITEGSYPDKVVYILFVRPISGGPRLQILTTGYAVESVHSLSGPKMPLPHPATMLVWWNHLLVQCRSHLSGVYVGQIHQGLFWSLLSSHAGRVNPRMDGLQQGSLSSSTCHIKTEYNKLYKVRILWLLEWAVLPHLYLHRRHGSWSQGRL